MKKILFVLVIAFASFSAQAQFGGLFGPENYDQCILENMKGVTSDVAAGQIANSCRKEFPAEEKTAGRPLSPEELEKITLISYTWPDYGYLTLELHNANDFCVGSLVHRISVEFQNTDGQTRPNRVIDLTFRPRYGRSDPLSVTDFDANAGDRPDNTTWTVGRLSGTRCTE